MDLGFVLVRPAECLTKFVRSRDDYNYGNLAYLIQRCCTPAGGVIGNPAHVGAAKTP